MFALPIFPGSRPPSIVGVHVLNFCVRDGREPRRRLWRIQRGRSVGSGRRGTKAHCRRGHPPGTATGNRWTVHPVPTKNNLTTEVVRSICSRYLFSQAVARQVSSAYMCLTSVFGMGTGGPTRQSTQTHYWKRFSPSYIQPIYVDFCY